MSTDTTKGSAAASSSGSGPGSGAGSGSGKKKPVRRVRVIEVIDDGDLDDIEDVLATLDQAEADVAEADAAEADTAEKSEPAAQEKPKRTPSARKKPPVKEPDESDESDDSEDLEEPKAAASAASSRATTDQPVGLLKQAVPGGMITAGVLVVLLAVTASLAIWQWSRASSLSSDKDERAKAATVASDFGGAIFTYDADHLQAQMDHTSSLMTGDLQKRYLTNEPSVKDTFTKNPTMKLTAKASKVYVGDVNGKFVTVMAQIDANLSADSSKALPSSGAFLITLAKVNGQWKVTDMASTDPSATPGNGGIPNLGNAPTPSASPTPSSTPSK